MEWTDWIKIYGPLGLGWPIAIYLGKFILDRYTSDIDARIKLALALDKLTDAVGGEKDRP